METQPPQADPSQADPPQVDPTERPLSFAAPMVHAVQAGWKTVTRRPVYPQPPRIEGSGTATRLFRADGREILCTLGSPGKRLWVRERFAELSDGSIVFAADPVKGRSRLTWHQSRYLPRQASRLLLEITSVHPEPLHAITESDARAEGMNPTDPTPPLEWFKKLWNRLAVPGLFWDEQPWVWVIRFRVLTGLTAPQKEPEPQLALTFEPATDAPPDDAPPVEAPDDTPDATAEQRRRLADALRHRPS